VLPSRRFRVRPGIVGLARERGNEHRAIGARNGLHQRSIGRGELRASELREAFKPGRETGVERAELVVDEVRPTFRTSVPCERPASHV
jgi:hypothetical protein